MVHFPLEKVSSTLNVDTSTTEYATIKNKNNASKIMFSSMLSNIFTLVQWWLYLFSWTTVQNQNCCDQLAVPGQNIPPSLHWKTGLQTKEKPPQGPRDMLSHTDCCGRHGRQKLWCSCGLEDHFVVTTSLPWCLNWEMKGCNLQIKYTSHIFTHKQTKVIVNSLWTFIETEVLQTHRLIRLTRLRCPWIKI